MALPTSRANAAMRIAANQFMQAKQANPNANDEDLIDNLNAVPDVIKDFLKKKASTSRVANLQSSPASSNPLMAQHQIYSDLVTRLVAPFAPKMSQGRAVAGTPLSPQKALEYLHSDPDFQSLPAEYQQYAIGVVGGQDALTLHANAMTRMKADQGLITEANKDALGFAQSPTQMVNNNLKEGKWFVDSDNRLKKKEKNPVSGMEEVLPLSPWETLHAVKEGHKTGFGDLTQYINPAQQAGLAALRDNPDASVSDIVKMVSAAKGSIANLQTATPAAGAPVSPERAATLAALNAERLPSPERLQTMKDLGYLPASPTILSGPSAPDPDFPDSRNAAVLSMIGRGQRKRTYDAAPNPVFAAGQAIANSHPVDTAGDYGINKVAPFIAATGQNMLGLAGKFGLGISNFLRGIRGQPEVPVAEAAAGTIPLTSPAQIKPATDKVLLNTIPDWLVQKGLVTDPADPTLSYNWGR